MPVKTTVSRCPVLPIRAWNGWKAVKSVIGAWFFVGLETALRSAQENGKEEEKVSGRSHRRWIARPKQQMAET